MRKISSGAKAKVYDNGNTVWKIPQSVGAAQWQFLKWGYLLDSRSRAKNAVFELQESIQGVQAVLSRRPDIAPTLANPRFHDGGVVVQDKVEVLGSRLHTASQKHARYLIDQYSDLHLLHCNAGFADTVFNFTVNNGVDDDDQVVLIDFGEVTFSRDVAVDMAVNTRWKRAASFLIPIGDYSLPPPLKKYYQKRMEDVVTAESVGSAWPD